METKESQMTRQTRNNPSGRYLQMNAEQTEREQRKFDRAVQQERERLGHCTTTFGHYPACDRDGRYCSLVSTHTGPCKPHGVLAKPRTCAEHRIVGCPCERPMAEND